MSDVTKSAEVLEALSAEEQASASAALDVEGTAAESSNELETGTDQVSGSAEPVAEAQADEPVAEAPAVEESVAEESVAVEPVTEEPVIEEPVIEEPVVEQPVAEQAAVSEPEAASATASEPVAEVDADQAAETETPAATAAEATTENSADTVAEETATPEAATAETASSESGSSDGTRVVRTLAVGQEVTGTVKRISEFGAFVDIGVGRDGLVHISELSVRRVGKVTDVINEGQEVTLWIKKLDRERNRISLTLISPGTVTIRDLNKDDVVKGTVTRILPYGAFVDIGVGRDALLHVREMGERYIAKPEEVLKVGEEIEARIIEIQRRRGRIDLSIKGLRPEPEAEPATESTSTESAPREYNANRSRAFGEGSNRDYSRGASRSSENRRGGQRQEAQQPAEPELPDNLAELEVLSPMELAFRKAQEKSGVELDYGSKSKKKGKQRRDQEDIFERTLKNR